MTRQGSRFRIGAAILVCLASLAGSALNASALVRFDFEQKFHVHPGRQTWDFSVVRDAGVYHLFYHSIAVATPHSSYADTIWHATSNDLAHWEIAGPVVLSGSGTWDSRAIWAPDVFRDEAGDRWAMAYTGADDGMNQRIGFAFSPDLHTWTLAPQNPVIEPDTLAYLWNPDNVWSDFRDPYVYRQDDQWHVLVTAAQYLGARKGVLYHAVADDLLNWTDVGPLFINDGPSPWKVLESSQYHVFGDRRHLFCGEFDTIGVSHVSVPDTLDLTMDERMFIDDGYAPEVDCFDPDVHILSRIVPLPTVDGAGLDYVIRFDTLIVSTDGDTVTVHDPHPLDGDWPVRTGLSPRANPTFGDNPLRRGEDPVGLVGNGYFGSGEYFQGPLSDHRSPGAYLGGGATGEIESSPFTVTGDRMDLLVGGANNPDLLYVALVDAATDSVLRRETGPGAGPMEPRSWDLSGLKGRTCVLRIVDAATGPDDIINVDEIIEQSNPPVAGVDGPGPWLATSVVPNPANPRAEVRFQLGHRASVALQVFDARGRQVWSGTPVHHDAGPVRLGWSGVSADGRAIPSGVYLYRVVSDGATAAVGKLSLVR